MAKNTNPNAVVIFQNRNCLNAVASVTEVVGVTFQDDATNIELWAPATCEMLDALALYLEDDAILELKNARLAAKNKKVNILWISRFGAAALVELEG